MRHGEIIRTFLEPISAFGEGFRGAGPVAFKNSFSNMLEASMMPLEVTETDDKFQVKVEIPGVEKDKINVYVDDEHYLNIEAEKLNNREEKDDKHYYSERSYGSFKRKIYVENNIDLENIEAKYNDGVLLINLNKKMQAKKPIAIS
mgnify:CR=1 FL=1